MGKGNQHDFISNLVHVDKRCSCLCAYPRGKAFVRVNNISSHIGNAELDVIIVVVVIFVVISLADDTVHGDGSARGDGCGGRY